ncbi:P-loop containing nucleoside triphosphate hydrolase protein [Peniophora sp. CONT]|nr:P-loop containing nucleoside triphosphate hydrolase protein [Peniophora sp. CONT]
MADVDEDRLRKLTKNLDNILNGRTSVTPRSAALFLESIYSQPERVACVHKLISSSAGLTSLQKGFFVDLTPAAFNSHASQVLLYLQAPELKEVGGGEYLHRVLKAICDPPVFWDAFADAFRDGKLADNAQHAFAWLLLYLASLPGDDGEPHRERAQKPGVVDGLIGSPNEEARALGHQLKHLIETRSLGAGIDVESAPGGRHDNDFADFRKIAILPTADEVTSKRLEFLRTAFEVEEVPEEQRVATHLDNQFRLYREDMLHELRDELQIALGQKKGKHRGLVVEYMKLAGMYGKALGRDERGRNDKWGLVLSCPNGFDFWFFKKDKPKNREKWLMDDRNKRYVKDGSMAALIVDGRVVSFPNIRRIESLLAMRPPQLVLQIEGERAFVETFCSFRNAKNIKLVQIDTAVFSYEPVLKVLQDINTVTLASELFLWISGRTPALAANNYHLLGIADTIKRAPSQDLRSLLQTAKSIQLDDAQAKALLTGLTQKVSLIQGPPGTGKSFIGALLTKALHDMTSDTILVCCYTNHALDQFLEDLLDIGIPESSIVRLGGKSTTRTETLSLYNKKRNSPFRRADWNDITEYRNGASTSIDQLTKLFKSNQHLTVSFRNILSHIEFEDGDFFDALSVSGSAADDGMQQVGAGGKDVQTDYLLRRWVKGENAGIFAKADNVRDMAHIWSMPLAQRRKKRAEWESAIFREQAEKLFRTGHKFDGFQTSLERKFAQGEGETLRNARIVGCTTTAAAKYTEHLRAASPGIVVVEEAGEILESHVLTALGPRTERLVLIGDHKQLRPKVDNYRLTVEKGDGYDLNRSLFERLVLKGYPHTTLSKQHRMRPEIASYPRRLTYPELVDAAGTLNRPDLRGVRDNIVFIAHTRPEDADISDDLELGRKSSKQNTHEVEMVLKILRYLAQQGYGTDKIVILTPYLGQLHRLREALQKDNDPVLNDLDSFDLVRAGLLSTGAAQVAKKPIRLATIDNYQGEESEIVITSLVRSNPAGDIGFMFSPERLNVLLSRARDALIMIGNLDTFSNSRKGKDLWTKLFTLLKQDGHIYDGLPIECVRHPGRKADLALPEHFDLHAPDGGCKEPCTAILSCGIHPCPSRCHQISDHTKMKCERIMEDTCSNGHRRTWSCHEDPPVNCRPCERAAEIAEAKRKKAFEAEQKREAEKREYARKLAEIDAEIEAEREEQLEAERRRQRDATLRQREHDRDALLARAKKPIPTRSTVPSSPAPPSSDPTSSTSTTSTSTPSPLDSHTPPATVPSAPPPPAEADSVLTDEPSAVSPPAPVLSLSEQEWQRQKDVEGADNPSIDAIMDMTGLEDVKSQVLRIKAKIDTSQRQGTSTKGERFNVVFLGNPGTGKTTVARHYAKFLTSVGVLPGTEFFETSGSRLANEGVPGVKKELERILKADGGAIFIDEAYQLVGQNSYGGSQVLDFILTEMENHVDKLVFIFAGYSREMERFFEFNPGLSSRVPYRLRFQDYTDEELLTMLEKLVEKKYSGCMKIEGGMRGLYARVAVRRLGRGRGREGFGNARALHIMFSAISERQATRLTDERRKGLIPDDFLFKKEDLIGPDPSEAVLASASWKALMSLIGLGEVKQSIQNLFDLIAENYRRELREKEPIQMSLNSVFLGNPGTGKTTVAKLYGQVLADLGLLSNGEVVLKNPADFKGGVLGESESRTKAILAASLGKVLVIDEAYSLYGASGSGTRTMDPYSTAVIDTIVAEIQSVPGEDRCVIMCGYEAPMREMFQNVNPGLSRRFRIEDAFRFQDFNDDELLEILTLKLKAQNLDATLEAKAVAIDVLSRARNRPNFGNGGEVENLLGQAKGRAQARRSALPLAQRAEDVVFEPADFDPDFNRLVDSGENLHALFADVVGSEKIVEKLEDYQNTARIQHSRGRDSRQYVPTTFVFKGPPGTGKTTTARKMGKVYFDMGLLSSVEVVERSASDLMGEYVGQTGPKTLELFRKALGKVLFIDEAYRLSEGPYAKEAMDELVGILTQEEFEGRLVVILAGYDNEMNHLMAVNPGLASRFPEEIYFDNLSADASLHILQQELDKEQISCAALTSPTTARSKMVYLLNALASLPSWGNARDIKTLARQMIRAVFKRVSQTGASDHLTLSNSDALACLEAMLKERSARAPIELHLPSSDPTSALRQRSPPRAQPTATVTAQAQATRIATPEELSDMELDLDEDDFEDLERDAGVSDAVWQQLQADKHAQEEAQARQEEVLRDLEKSVEEARAVEKAEKARNIELANRARTDNEAARLLEQQRLKKIEAAAEAARRARAHEAERKRQIEERRKEARAQEKLRTMGVCPVGYRWIKQCGGYRCAGGSHYVSSAELGV